jgi:hypothetical protein
MTSSFVSASLALVVAALAAGCATDSQPAASSTNEAKPAPEYRTGSNIPVREPRTESEQDKARAGTSADKPRGTEPGKTN